MTTCTDAPERFEFGENWHRFLTGITEPQVEKATESLARVLGHETFRHASFLDAGSGSGLSSLAARRLGARVHSFDYDPGAVACTTEIRRRYRPNDTNWTVEQGSVMDRNYLRSLGSFDVVYSWGVLHHTGDLWTGMANVLEPLAEGGRLFLAIYNDQGGASRRWEWVKQAYNRLPEQLRFVLLGPGFLRLWGPTFIRDALTRGRPFHTWKSYGQERGMSPWYDVVDWIGGYPFEVATPDEVFHFYHSRKLILRHLRTCGGGRGCNEFVFERPRGT